MSRAPNPVFQLSASARVLIVGQAPGNLADLTGVPFNDPSGDRLRDWMGIDRDMFYDASRIAIFPMGMCFPGYDSKGGDRPPMKRCAPEWRPQVLPHLRDVRLTLLVGSYAQKWHLRGRGTGSLTDTVRAWQSLISERIFTTPHPSWRNTAWLKRNSWFEADVLPALRDHVRLALQP